jgi:hypothetical protein
MPKGVKGFQKGNKVNLGRTGSKNGFYGKKHKPETIAKFKKDRAQSKNPMWKGDEVGYDALHDWVKRHRGKPERCQFCGEENASIQWANKSGKYKRKLEDWLELCIKCHVNYDENWKKRKRDKFGRFK